MFKHRVARNRVLYFAVLLLVLIAFAYLITNFHWELYQLLIIALVFLVPGRLVQYYWRDFFKGRKNLEKKNYDKAIQRFELFLKDVEESPWIKWLMFFSYGLYSFKVEAVALAYLGKCNIYKRNLEQAEQFLNRALQTDSKYPVAFFNLSVIYVLRNDEITARRYFDAAREHGYPKMKFENLNAFIRDEFTAPN
ncbi:hypothetical protein F9K33_09430 [bacterium]|nr:MAG: hypothetical protein F9K33_09430 [bacterium]